jgi:hypothetical protein
MAAVMGSTVRAGADMRLLRAAVFTAVCVVLAAAGHMAASGRGVPFWTLAAGWLAVFAVVAPLAGRERSLPGIAVGLGLGQIALHVLFDIGQSCAEPAAPRQAGGIMAIAERLVCNHDAARLTPEAAARIVRGAGIDTAHAAATTAATMPMGGTPKAATSAMSAMSAMSMYSLSMLLWHTLAALIAGWLLRRGEAALWRLVALSAGVLRYVFGLVRVLAAGVVRGPATALRGRRFARRRGRPRTVRLRHSLARRGPPVPALGV